MFDLYNTQVKNNQSQKKMIKIHAIITHMRILKTKKEIKNKS